MSARFWSRGETSRNTDIVACDGREEFYVLLPNTGTKGAKQLAERARRAMEALAEPVPTMSIGFACAEQGMTAEELVKQADKKPYRARGTEQNR